MNTHISRSIRRFFGKNKELLLYLFFGGLSFLFNLSAFIFFNKLLRTGVLVANILSWFLTVLFVFLTNRKYVFAYNKTLTRSSLWRQALRFYAGRAATLLIEEVLLFVFIIKLGCSSLLVKAITQIVVIILNYIISKIWIFSDNTIKHPFD